MQFGHVFRAKPSPRRPAGGACGGGGGGAAEAVTVAGRLRSGLSLQEVGADGEVEVLVGGPSGVRHNPLVPEALRSGQASGGINDKQAVDEVFGERGDILPGL